MSLHKIAAVTGTAAIVTVLGLGGIALANDDEDFEADLTGAEEIPGPGDPDGEGDAELEIDADAGEVCFDVEWDDIATPTAGHIHAGASGVAGPIVVDLLGGAAPDDLEADDDYDACVPGDPAVLNAILADPGAYYVNVHNPRFPTGAVRGQLHED